MICKNISAKTSDIKDWKISFKNKGKNKWLYEKLFKIILLLKIWFKKMIKKINFNE